MNNKSILSLLAGFLVILVISCSKTGEGKKDKTQKNYTYTTVEGDPFKARVYTLDNGLKVFLRRNAREPEINSLIVVKVGGTDDPQDATGLAHYFEHMMFKGTDEIGTTDWPVEKQYLDRIEALFEERRKSDGPAARDSLYLLIDSLSLEASKYTVANEYDKLINSIGGKGTNAFTSWDMTAYLNTIPSNQLEKWLRIESERFSDIALRLFHTELETVYEEYNRLQDNDNRKAYYRMLELLFPKHPYGDKVIGKVEHIKNPSMTRIKEFFDTWYVPNNMAICLSGELDYDKTIALIDKYFGQMKANENLPGRERPAEAPISKPVEETVYGPDREFVQVTYRFDYPASSKEKATAIMADMVLSNGMAGLIDLNLAQQQKVIAPYSGLMEFRDYSMYMLSGRPRQGQSLEEVKALLMEQIEKLKKGEFEDWLPEAITRKYKLEMIKALKENGVVYYYLDAFIKNISWEDQVRLIEHMEKVGKEDIMAFANTYFDQNYAVIYKRTGKDPNVVKVEKPPITPVEMNRDAQSEFFTEMSKIEPPRLEPRFLDFDKLISKGQFADGVDYHYIKNEDNELFQLYYVLDMGSRHDRMLAHAINYLDYLGTDKYTPEEIKKELFRYGLYTGVSAGADRSYIYVLGLDESFEKGLEMLEHLTHHAKADPQIWQNYVSDIAQRRADAKLDKNKILGTYLWNYAKYGPENPSKDQVPVDELMATGPALLTGIVDKLTNYPHKVFYFGPRNMDEAKAVIAEKHSYPAKLEKIPEEKTYPELDMPKDRVYYVPYDMVQCNILFLSKGPEFSPELMAPARVFNEYYGSALSSIIFQEIRESKGLAYAAYGHFSTPGEKGRHHYVSGFVGTQPDKMETALGTLLGLMDHMKEAPTQFELSRESIIKKIEAQRITDEDIYWRWLDNLDRGLQTDYRREVYEQVKTMGLADMAAFFEDYISSQHYTFLVIGPEDAVDKDVLRQFGELEELSLEELFGY